MFIDEDELLGYFDTLSNWGRWGSDDVLGTLNFISPDRRRAAAALVRDGLSLGLGRPLAPQRPGPDDPRFLHLMTQSGEAAPETGFWVASDWIGLEFHGYQVTHLDAPSHVFWNGRMYNGRPANLVETRRGAMVAGVDAVKDGIVGRGVLLDIARYRDQAGGEHDAPITIRELDECVALQGSDVGVGDILLVRGGRDLPRRDGRPRDSERERPGLQAECLRWLYDRSIALLGSDAVSDVRPSGYQTLFVPIHTIGIVAMGLWLIDNLYLERLAEHCARTRRWEFCVVLSPLALKNATGSPINPTALL